MPTEAEIAQINATNEVALFNQWRNHTAKQMTTAIDLLQRVHYMTIKDQMTLKQMKAWSAMLSKLLNQK